MRRIITALILISTGFSCSKKIVQIETETIEVIADTMVIVEERIDSIQVQELIPPDTVIYYKKTPCYGSCEAFDVAIYSDGNAIFNGQKNCSYLGKHKCTLSSETINYIEQMLRSFSIFSMQNKYPENIDHWILDLQSSTLIAKLDEERKEIHRNHSAPETYVDFENELFQLIINQHYEKINH